MHRTARWMLAAAALMAGASASAGPLALWVGQKQTLFIVAPIEKVEISDGSVIRTSPVPKVGLDLRAVAPGVSDVKITCKGGETYSFRVHSTRGAEVYSTDRSEPEHYQWSLTSAPK